MAYAIYQLKRLSNTVTVTTEDAHPFMVGSKIVINGVLGGGTATFSGTTVRTLLTAGTYDFTYAQTGANGTADSNISISSIGRYNQSANQIQLTTSSAHGIISTRKIPIRISGVTQSTGTGLTTLINQSTAYAATEYEVTSSTQLVVTLRKTSIADWSPVLSGGTLTSSSVSGVVMWDWEANPDGGSGGSPDGSTGITPITDVTTQPITKTTQETVAVKQLLKIVDNAKAGDAYVQRLLRSSDTTKITTNTATGGVQINQPSSTLRSALDTLVEIYGADLKKRRYFVNLSQQLVYDIISDTAPTYANAPYTLTTAMASPNGTTVSSVNPYQLSVTWDHDTTKRAIFNIPVQSSTPKVSTVTYNGSDALGSAYTRRGNPILDAVVDYPNSAGDGAVATGAVAKNFFLERHAPVLTITAEIRGAGTAAWNNLGFSSGYYQTGASTYALATRWEPGQYVAIVAPELGLNDKFRIEQVEWSLEPGSYMQVIRITANRRPAVSLTSLIAKGKK